jgi:hypothetical protein
MAEVNHVCASDTESAIAAANAKAVGTLKLRDQNITGTTCTDTGKTRDYGQSAEPRFMPQTIPGGCGADPGDDACVVCAKAACCADYQACAADLNCSCLVGCLYQGNSVATCTATDNCGPFSPVATSTTACLVASCSAQCVDTGGVGSTMCPEATSGAGGGPPAPLCTPGPTGSGEPCFSDGDCASCICSMQTMTCG